MLNNAIKFYNKFKVIVVLSDTEYTVKQLKTITYGKSVKEHFAHFPPFGDNVSKSMVTIHQPSKFWKLF